ncbi:hypothetical protein Salat_2410000 [Sesamum alatum]|uniref:Uncharacterized protein n=1 Tax=Sesamum alatum TaxID=300844 RepID=A0AAE1XYL0_9LAMI|nr:hypothetical protein Salat_2410000 [Sesamum alatum]
MIPNHDLILLSLLHASFISCVLLLVTFVVLICLLLAFCIMLLLIAFLDIYDALLFFSWYVADVKSNIELAFVVTLFSFMRFFVHMSLASKPIWEGITVKVRVKMQQLRGQPELH